MKFKSNNVALTFCPPLSTHPEQPKDGSECSIEECPHCQQEMWLSIKKKELMKLAEKMGKDNVLTCYTCLEGFIKDNPVYFKKLLSTALHIEIK